MAQAPKPQGETGNWLFVESGHGRVSMVIEIQNLHKESFKAASYSLRAKVQLAGRVAVQTEAQKVREGFGATAWPLGRQETLDGHGSIVSVMPLKIFRKLGSTCRVTVIMSPHGILHQRVTLESLSHKHKYARII